MSDASKDHNFELRELARAQLQIKTLQHDYDEKVKKLAPLDRATLKRMIRVMEMVGDIDEPASKFKNRITMENHNDHRI